jgi:tetratricopeptide (TPR) repeat protein
MNIRSTIQYVSITLVLSCSGNKTQDQIQKELQSINLVRGEITLCGSGTDQFGSTSFSLSCSAEVKSDFNLAIALLHSFEYTEAEKVFADVIDRDPHCVMAYWGAAMSNFHQLWMPPSPAELEKGSRLVALARSLVTDRSSRESDYLEAIASIYDDWKTLDHRTRLLKYEQASEKVYEKYPDDVEAAIFYSLALTAAADPTDKSFKNQRKAGEILDAIFLNNPKHPGIAHYIIHTYDYPELALLGLPAARKYASIAPASAHAQHMPSHIFTRLGLWKESILSDTKSVEAAKCYAEASGIRGHWDEELHGLDYLTYAYLQQADDAKAKELINYLGTITDVFPVNFKDAYCFASMPARYALERQDWTAAAELTLAPATFPWDKFLWEKANVYFARLLGSVHLHQIENAKRELRELEAIHSSLSNAKETYQANLVMIQVKTSQGWIAWAEGDIKQALHLMTEAAGMEDATAKHPVTPGEIIPARELLGDLYMKIGDYQHARLAYEADLKNHPNRFNGVFGAGLASEKSGDYDQAKQYYEQLVSLANPSGSERPQLQSAGTFLKRKK